MRVLLLFFLTLSINVHANLSSKLNNTKWKSSTKDREHYIFEFKNDTIHIKNYEGSKIQFTDEILIESYYYLGEKHFLFLDEPKRMIIEINKKKLKIYVIDDEDRSVEYLELTKTK